MKEDDMKKKSIFWMVGILILIVIVGIITNYADSANLTTGHEPSYCIKRISKNGDKVTYWGLGYKVIRYVSVSPHEPYEQNIGVKMGSWFMKYELPNPKIVQIQYNGTTMQITNHNDISVLENILLNSKYDSGICDGIATYTITIDNQTYSIKQSCKEIQKDDKQAPVTEEDLNTILKIIERNQSDEL